MLEKYMNHVWSLGKYKLIRSWPTRGFTNHIACELGLSGYDVMDKVVTDIRWPGDWFSMKDFADSPRDDVAEDWHQDTMYSDNGMMLFLWASHLPTEIRRIANPNEVYIPDPNEIVMFNNRLFEHRMPKINKAQAEHRIFMRGSWHL